MEAHPIPQNVTNFEFHLVGDMTLKQFGYLAGGVGIAYLLFVFFSGSIPLIAWPLIGFFALSGVALAFLPIMERPLDHWVGSYFRAIFQPTQRAWNSKLAKVADPAFSNRLNMYLSKIEKDEYRQQRGAGMPLPKMSILSQLAPTSQPLVQSSSPVSAPVPAPVQQPLPPTPLPQPLLQPTKPEPAQTVTPPALPPVPVKSGEPLPSSQELEATVELAKKAQEVQTKIVETERMLDQVKREAAMPGVDPALYTGKSEQILAQLQQLTTEASAISAQMAVLTHSQKPVSPKQVIPAVKKQVQTNIVLTSTPNIVNGIVTDSMNNYLEGVIVVTHDKQGLPVRALKTNKLGQFVAATPLPSGEYTLTLEKDNLLFDNVQVVLDGKVLSPIVISAKRGGI